MTRCWIAVASRDHVLRGVEGSFCQAGPGSRSPLRRMVPGDWIAYYSPTATLRGTDRCQSFTAIGRISEAEIEQTELPDGSPVNRRPVHYLPCREAPIQPLIEELAFITAKQQWGYSFKRGFFEISLPDFRQIAVAMRINIDADPPGPLLTLVQGGAQARPAPESIDEAAWRTAYLNGMSASRPEEPAGEGNIAGELAQVLAELGINPRALYAARAQELGLPFVDLTVFVPMREAVAAIPHELARRWNALAVRKEGNTLYVALDDVANQAAHDEIRLAARCQILPVVAAPGDLKRAIALCYQS